MAVEEGVELGKGSVFHPCMDIDFVFFFVPPSTPIEGSWFSIQHIVQSCFSFFPRLFEDRSEHHKSSPNRVLLQRESTFRKLPKKKVGPPMKNWESIEAGICFKWTKAYC